MLQPRRLLTPPDRTMLSVVDRSFFRVAAFGVACSGPLLSTGIAAAQQAPAADSGWFDTPASAEPSPRVYGSEPSQRLAPAPTPAAPPAPAAAPAPGSAQSQVEDTDPSALTTFRPALDPYGVWVNDPTYGTVWVPNRDVVGSDFAPYVSRGRWSLTADNDWIWVSDYPFGWAVFHYGRWVWTTSSGWAWIPGRTYANAWVVWRVPTAGYSYVGWAPMPPTWGWRGGYAFSLWYSPPLPYVFCPSAYLFDYHLHYHIVRDRHLMHQIAASTHVHPTTYRRPAQPSIRTDGPAPRAARIAPSEAPRGPAMAAARVPERAVPATRMAPPAAATRLANERVISVGTRDAFRRVADVPVRTTRVRSESRDFIQRESLRPRDTYSTWARDSRATWATEPRSSWSSGRTTAAPRVQIEPRSSFDSSRIHVAPSMPRTFTTSPHNFAPMRSFSPAMPRGGDFRGGGGGNFRRR